MVMDFEVQRCTRRCALSDRELRAGEMFYSALVVEQGQVVRRDFASECWTQPPEHCLAWWTSHLPEREAPKVRLAPNEVLLSYFRQLEGQRERCDVVYVLALLLVRRRVFRLEDTLRDPDGTDVLVVYCPRDEATYRVRAVALEGPRIAEIQQQLSDLLFAGG